MAVDKALVQNQDVMHLEENNVHDMAIRLSEMKQKLDLVQKFFKDVMVKDVDYGIVPGTQKPTLLKPGAEKLCELYNFAIIIADKEEEKDLQTGYYRAKLVIRLVHRGTGALVAEGTGEANVYESKYRYRWVSERDLPRGIDKDSLVSKEFESKSGATYKKYRIENTDLFDHWNTVLKMAKKRALVDAVLSATRSSGIFSQAEDELDAWIEGEAEEVPDVPPPSPAKPAQQATNPQPGRVAQHGAGKSASEKQIKAMFAIGRNKGLTSEDVKELVLQETGKEINNLTIDDASKLIDFLQNADRAELLARLEPASDDVGDEAPSLFGGGQA